MTEAEIPQPRTCVHCGQSPRGLSIPVGTDSDGNRLIACIPTCPKRQSETNGETR
jgi:hypothetical protein